MNELERKIEVKRCKDNLKDIQKAMGELMMQKLYWEQILNQLEDEKAERV